MGGKSHLWGICARSSKFQGVLYVPTARWSVWAVCGWASLEKEDGQSSVVFLGMTTCGNYLWKPYGISSFLISEKYFL